MSRYFTEWESRMVTLLYPISPGWWIGEIIGKSDKQVYQHAHRLGIHKSPEYLATPFSGRLRPGTRVGEGGWFPKGHIPANKGTRRPGYAPGRMAETQFKKGGLPVTTMPIGSLRLDKQGTLQRKVRQVPGSNSKRWRSVHELVWIEVNGPVPKGHICVFKPGTRTNVLEEITLDKVECISFADNMRRNTIHKLPPSLKEVVQLRGRIIRQINRRTRREKQDLRSA